ncbi:MAG: pyridoxamine 5'-phosphate oxidase family protein [Anaerovoracaceae bacterium]
MHKMQRFYELLEKTNELAIATSVDNIPNVRVVNFTYDIDRLGILYFAASKTASKVEEFSKNANVAIATIPAGDELKSSIFGYIHSNSATVKKSDLKVDDVLSLFWEKVPDFSDVLALLGDEVDIYEIHIRHAYVVDGKETYPVVF